MSDGASKLAAVYPGRVAAAVLIDSVPRAEAERTLPQGTSFVWEESLPR